MDKKSKVMVVGRNQEMEETIAKLENVHMGDKDIKVATDELNIEDLQDEVKTKYQKARGEVSLPEVGLEFSINGQIFKVTYVNEGKKRLSVEPVV